MMTLEIQKRINELLFDLYREFEDANTEEIKACSQVWRFYNEIALEKSCRTGSEGQEELEKLVENGLDQANINYIENKTLEAYELVSDSRLLKYYCYYMMICEQISEISELLK